jgi:hypothetical protein
VRSVRRRSVVADPEALIERLIKHQVEFVVVGTHAAEYQGCEVGGDDPLELCLDLGPVNLLRLHGALDGLEPVHRKTSARSPFDRSAAKMQWQSLYLDTRLASLDAHGRIDGVGDYEDAADESDEFELGDGTFLVLGIDALIRAETVRDRPDGEALIAALRALRDEEG